MLRFPVSGLRPSDKTAAVRSGLLFCLLSSVALAPALAQTNGGYAVNIHNRAEVRSFYNTIYLSSENVPMNSSASATGCIAGTNSYAYRDATIRRINFYRALAGIFANVTEDKSSTPSYQAAAYLCSRNGQLNHLPPTSWACYTQAGAGACGPANLGVGNGPAAIDLYILDPGNFNVGHRRWMLNPPMGSTALGDVALFGFPVNATSIFDTTSPYTTNRDGFVSWPPPGFVPAQLVSSLWSFSLPGTDFGQASVVVTSNTVAIPVAVQPMQNGFGQDAFVWSNAVPAGPITDDIIYTVTLQNLWIGGAYSNISYSVILFNPTNVATAPVAVTLPATDVTNDSSLGTARAIFQGTIRPGGSGTVARFEFGLTTNYGAATPWTFVGSGTNDTAFNVAASGLASGAACHYRLVATNAIGSANGVDQSFTAPAFFQPGDMDGDGIISQGELNAVLSNYWPHSPWLYLTNVAGLGETNVTFSLTNSTVGAFSVEYSTNLATWQFLGPATPRFLFSDTNAPVAPQRYYRLRWP